MSETIFKNNVVIITGASSGIGRAVALQLAEQGAWLVLAARNIERLEEVSNECRLRGGRALVVKTDVSQEIECRNLIERTISEYGHIDTLINNAGISMFATFEELRHLWIIERIMQVNFLGATYLTYYALPYLKQSRGRLVAVASLTGKISAPNLCGYVASKYAMVGFFESLRIELMTTGVSVTIIYPGYVKSELRTRCFGADGQPYEKSPRKKVGVMSTEKCAQIMIKAIAKRKREKVMTLRGKLGLWLKMIAPSIVDKMMLKEGKRWK